MQAAELAWLQQQLCGPLGLTIDDDQARRLLGYVDLLQRWNSTYNLTAVRDRAAMLSLHLADCLAVVPALKRHMDQQSLSGGARVLDVGSGGGLPGALLAILMPQLQVTCVETVGKKAAFIQQAAGALALPNLVSLHSRVEQLQALPFNLVTSRAFASLVDFTNLTARHLAPGAVWMAMKGRQPDDEIAELAPRIDVFHVEHLTVPGLSADRCLVWMRLQPAQSAMAATT